MSFTGLIVNLSNASAARAWRMVQRELGNELHCEYHDSAASAIARLESGNVAALVVFSETATSDLDGLFAAFRHHVGCLPDHQAIISTHFDPMAMAHVFEHGVDRFFSLETWAEEAISFFRDIGSLLKDPQSPEARIIELTHRVANDPRTDFSQWLKSITELTTYDFRVAYTEGVIYLANDNHSKAVESFRKSSLLNNLFRPSLEALGTTLLEMGRGEDALIVFKKMAETNPFSAPANAHLACTYLALGDIMKANVFAEKAEKIDSGNREVIEARAQILLSQERYQEALSIMGAVKNVSSQLVSRMNLAGIAFARSGDVDEALDFFRRAHYMCKPNDAYKISLNAAIACLGMNYPEIALNYLERCEREYGGTFVKLEKIRRIAIAADQKRARAA